MLATGWYRFVTSWRRRRAGYLALILIVGLGGGLALGSVAAARRTGSSFSTFLASTNPSDVVIEPAGGGPIGLAKDEQLVDAIRRFPHVRQVESAVALGASFVKPGTHRVVNFDGSVHLLGSIDGLFFKQDRFTVTQGRAAKPNDAHQVMVTEEAAKILGLHVGQSFTLGLDVPTSAHQRLARVTVAAIGELNDEVVQDQIQEFPTYVIATPALTRQALTQTTLAYFGVQLAGGARDVPQLERDWDASERYFNDYRVASQTTEEADQSIRPEALALGVFGGIAGLTTVLIAVEEIARQRRSRGDERRVMRSLGASPRMTVADGLIGSVGSIVMGGILALGVAVAVSPLSPIGPARSVFPGSGLHADWAVLGLGGVALVGLLLAASLTGAILGAPHREAGRVSSGPTVGASVFRSLPPSAGIGARFALQAGRGGDRTSTRWILAGAMTALLVVTATLTFGHSLQTLVSQPSLYGWNWNVAVQSSDGFGPVPQAAVRALHRRDPKVAVSGVWFTTFQLDGVEVPTLISNPSAAVAPPTLAGHGLTGRNQIVLGAATMAQLHKRLGDTIFMRYAPTFPSKAIALTIVGVATMPAIGIAEGLHTSMGIGAIVPADNGRLTEQFGPKGYPGCNGPNMVFLRSTQPAAAQHAAQSLASSASRLLAHEPASNSMCDGYQASVLAVQRPAQIVDYRSMGLTPLLLAVALAAGATVALGLSLAASVRRRRRELAILKAIGFTPAQLRSAVLWQAVTVAVAGIVVGLPLGAALGRWLWILFAEEIGAVPAPSVPVWSVVVASLAALLLAALLSAVPGRIAARTPVLGVIGAE